MAPRLLLRLRRLLRRNREKDAWDYFAQLCDGPDINEYHCSIMLSAAASPQEVQRVVDMAGQAGVQPNAAVYVYARLFLLAAISWRQCLPCVKCIFTVRSLPADWAEQQTRLLVFAVHCTEPMYDSTSCLVPRRFSSGRVLKVCWMG